MDIRELIKQVKESAKTRTREENIQLLKDAKIIDESGYYCEEFFSAETVAKDRANGKPLVI
ncbi:MAG: hypothetical protein HC939_18760 [Pleurocapsa sp. SU_5_0]|nr:hypothetical protein [Pleurocapsa sp. SU_5_0]